jgi:hypothetical protein
MALKLGTKDITARLLLKEKLMKSDQPAQFSTAKITLPTYILPANEHDGSSCKTLLPELIWFQIDRIDPACDMGLECTI